ncbi:MAG: hypothetical protein HND48_20930 [Chloroflexi bacterium]|nr:hypothetical protein [Chloroflexota bacterium]
MIGFTVYDLAVTRAASYPGFMWDTLTGALAPTPAYATPFVDVYPGSGEVIRAGADERLTRTENYVPRRSLQRTHAHQPADGRDRAVLPQS